MGISTTDAHLINCQAGHHDLTVIYKDPINGMCEAVVRWCKNCGCVVIDRDIDGRTSPGSLMKMRAPLIAQKSS